MSWVELDIEVGAVEGGREGPFLRVHVPLLYGQVKPHSCHCFRALLPLPQPEFSSALSLPASYTSSRYTELLGEMKHPSCFLEFTFSSGQSLKLPSIIMISDNNFIRI